jgi:hypothetical protein
MIKLGVDGKMILMYISKIQNEASAGLVGLSKAPAGLLENMVMNVQVT